MLSTKLDSYINYKRPYENSNSFWFQNLLGAEGTSLQWRLIASHVITRLSRDPISHKPEIGSAQNTSGTYILSELFQVLGYFAVNNPENQVSTSFEESFYELKSSLFRVISTIYFVESITQETRWSVRFVCGSWPSCYLKYSS